MRKPSKPSETLGGAPPPDWSSEREGMRGGRLLHRGPAPGRSSARGVPARVDLGDNRDIHGDLAFP